MKCNWNVTFERVHPCDADEEPEIETGFVWENTSFRNALDAVGGADASYEANSWPARGDVRWLTNDRYNHETHEWFANSIEESRSIHIPDQITPSSRIRLCRLLGVRP